MSQTNPPEESTLVGERPAWKKGSISWMTRNPVAANLMMIILLAGGLMMLPTIKQEVFPEFTIDYINVAVPYPGAAPEEAEQGIVLAIEEAVQGIDGVKETNSSAFEGLGQVGIRLLIGADPDRVLSDVKTAVDRIQSFPEDAERPTVSIFALRQQVISLVIAGPTDLRTLHELAESTRDDLLADPNITQVEIHGVPPLEINIAIPSATLEGLGLTYSDVARQIQTTSLELPGGTLKTQSGDLLVRMSDRRTSRQEYEDMIVRGTKDGANVRLGDIATITDGYEELELGYRYNGERAVRLQAFRIGDETPNQVATAMKSHADRLRSTLPDGVIIGTWQDDSQLLDERFDLLLKNARIGLILVLGVLTLFLQLRLAFWVALGIPISFLGAIFMMPTTDISLNMISLFAFIITLGLVVDDAIIVGENIYERSRIHGVSIRSSIEGAQQMIVPVTFSIITTMAAFAPMLFVPGVSGKLFRILPLIVILVLIFSLLESFLILPAHLAHEYRMPRLVSRITSPIIRPIERVQSKVSDALERFKERRYKPLLEAALNNRYTTASICLGTFIFVIGLIGSGQVPFTFMPALEANLVTATARLPQGTPVSRSKDVLAKFEQAAGVTTAGLDKPASVTGVFSMLGEGPQPGGPVPLPSEKGGYLVTVQVELVASADRDFTAAAYAERWENNLPPIAGIESMNFSSVTGPGGGPAVTVRLSHSDPDTLQASAEELTDLLETFPTLTGIMNTNSYAKPQLDFKLRDVAASVGATSGSVARQIRDSFYGVEALREQRDRNELKVRVQMPREEREREFAIEQFRVRTDAGAWVPLHSIASVERNAANTVIRREASVRTIEVSAELTPEARSAQDVLGYLEADYLPQLMAANPGLNAEFSGEQREQSETNASLARSYVLAMFVMYALLAIPFRSYLQPLVVMTAIPMGFVGAVFGHLAMGYSLSIISLFGIVALSGVVINDSLVLIDSTNQYRRAGASAYDAIVRGGMRRLRPILLTSLTTFFGLAPMIAETSMQAKFLIPMAISLGFGVLFATIIILVMVPAVYLIVDDLTSALNRLFLSSQDEVALDASPQPTP